MHKNITTNIPYKCEKPLCKDRQCNPSETCPTFTSYIKTVKLNLNQIITKKDLDRFGINSADLIIIKALGQNH